MKFQDIKKITRAKYNSHVPWTMIEDWITRDKEMLRTELEPDFQRAHVWDDQKRTKYVEFALKGGTSGKDIYWNCPGWMNRFDGPLQLVDGLQRITAVRKFLNNEIPAYGCLHKDYDDKIGWDEAAFIFHINDFRNRKDVLQWYIDLNDGGVVHTSEEIERVKRLLAEEMK